MILTAVRTHGHFGKGVYVHRMTMILLGARRRLHDPAILWREHFRKRCGWRGSAQCEEPGWATSSPSRDSISALPVGTALCFALAPTSAEFRNVGSRLIGFL